jgi:hypothetical protein
MLHIGYTGVTATELPDLLQIKENFMKVVRLSLNYCYLFMMVIIELKVFMQFKLIQVTLLLFTVVVLNLKNYFNFYVIVVKNDYYEHYNLDCYHYGNC